jgi:uncharacterized protein
MKIINLLLFFSSMVMAFKAYAQPEAEITEYNLLSDSLQSKIIARDSLGFACQIQPLNNRGDFSRLTRTCFSAALKNKVTFPFVLLVKQGATLNPKNATDWSPLAEACRMGNYNLVKTLISLGASCSAQPGQPAILNYAVLGGNPEIAALLLKEGASLNAHSGGNNALHIAAKKGNVAMAHFLISKGIALNQPFEKRSPLSVALESGQFEMAHLLISEGIRTDSIFYGGNMVPGLFALLESGCEDCLGSVKTSKAKWTEWYQAKNLLLLAAEKNNIKALDNIISLNLPLNYPDSDGNTPLMIACKEGHADFVSGLLNAHCTVSQANKSNETALDIALRHKQYKIARLLVKQGATHNKTTYADAISSIPKSARGPDEEELIKQLKIK